VANRIAQDLIAHLETCVGADPGASEFPALAEALRCAGRLQEAEDVARRGLERKPGCLGGSLVLALVLLDQGRLADAREELGACAAQLLTASGRGTATGFPGEALFGDEFAAEVTEGELERAFEAAETDRDQVVDADRVAQDAMRAADLATPETNSPVPDPIFATRTMADLLERQGDARGASQIRASLQADRPPASARGRGSVGRERVVAVLEGWLANLRSVQR